MPADAEQLVLIGAGGFGRETAELVGAINDAHGDQPRWDLLGFLDDDPASRGAAVSGSRVLGGLDTLAELPDARVVVCTGHPGNFASKRRIVERLALQHDRYATLVHPRAVLPPSCALGTGTVILAGVVATTDVTIGSHVAVMPNAVFTHDDRLEDFVTVASGVCLAGAVHIEAGAYLGGGVLVREYCTIGAGALIGMGAVVTGDVPGGEVWAGVPARRLRAARA